MMTWMMLTFAYKMFARNKTLFSLDQLLLKHVPLKSVYIPSTKSRAGLTQLET